MNASQMLAWFVCLALAGFAALLGVRNSVKLAVLEKRFLQVRVVAEEQTAVLSDIRDLLRQQRPGDLGSRPTQ
ncbi:MAG: hypothetical protein J7M08_04640 [Planctomycetes bacterium]|nr:hypothetical protein [Planctomycetota bacterium]